MPSCSKDNYPHVSMDPKAKKQLKVFVARRGSLHMPVVKNLMNKMRRAAENGINFAARRMAQDLRAEIADNYDEEIYRECQWFAKHLPERKMDSILSTKLLNLTSVFLVLAAGVTSATVYYFFETIGHSNKRYSKVVAVKISHNYWRRSSLLRPF